MMHPAIIEKRREDSEQEQEGRPCLHVPAFGADYSEGSRHSKNPETPKEYRGCEIVDFTI